MILNSKVNLGLGFDSEGYRTSFQNKASKADIFERFPLNIILKYDFKDEMWSSSRIYKRMVETFGDEYEDAGYNINDDAVWHWTVGRVEKRALGQITSDIAVVLCFKSEESLLMAKLML